MKSVTQIESVTCIVSDPHVGIVISTLVCITIQPFTTVINVIARNNVHQSHQNLHQSHQSHHNHRERIYIFSIVYSLNSGLSHDYLLSTIQSNSSTKICELISVNKHQQYGDALILQIDHNSEQNLCRLVGGGGGGIYYFSISMRRPKGWMILRSGARYKFFPNLPNQGWGVGWGRRVCAFIFER